ncbi:hypothetical protein H2200_000459 [Cladophialophora chaetospira]|uniref:Uncharacterized protein n=1 Tax=Cladophialophora chaetospira TaxID=386627 RepID=A0AA38XNH0_9EURO|nr:hypothetical protein H2200_000459 [Cladophialophora chaetospira]
MASITLDASLEEVLETLDLDKVPEKLRCFNDHRNSSCPKCDHKPFTDEICKPNKGMQKTIKTWLKSQEKAKSDAHDKPDTREASASQPNAGKPIISGDGQADMALNGEAVTEDRLPQVETVESEEIPAGDLQPSIEEPDHEVFDNDDDIEFQVELDDDEHQELPIQRPKSTEATPQPQSAKPFENHLQPQDQPNNTDGFDAMGGSDISNNMGGFNNNMDPAQMQQMMQMMQANIPNGMQNGVPYNPMMMAMMSNMSQMHGMLGGFGGQNGGMNMNGMNGMNMNMGMNFNPNQGMYGWNGQNNDMWQNNNANAFPNGMGSDFSSNYGFNMNQSGNFQQNYPSGDFQNGPYNGRGYGRGRGRGRGGFGRGRGNFNQYSQYQQQQSYQNNPGPRQFDNRNVQSQMVHSDRAALIAPPERADDNEIADEVHEDDEFAPGGQEEVQEALGDDYQKSNVAAEVATSDVAVMADSNGSKGPESTQQNNNPDVDQVTEPVVKEVPQAVEREVSAPATTAGPEKPIPDAYNEDLQGSMAPPSAPTGPSAKFGDYGFRSRGHGRFSSRGRDAMSMQNGHITSPVKPFSPAPPPTEPKGSGVVGAPTGPRAMREPAAPTRPLSRSAATGFQIMGRASLAASSRPESRDVDRRHSKSPDRESRDLSRRPSRHEKYSSSKGADEQDEADYREEKRSRKLSKRDTYDDHDRDDQEPSYPQSESAEYKSSSRRSRNEKDRPSKHSSRSRRHHDEDTNGDHEMEDYEDSARSSRDAYAESRSKHRSSKSSKYEDRERERDRDRDRDREKAREKERDKDREREDRHRERDREHRKRSRHDRHREDNGTGDYDYEQQEEAEEAESRHHSRRHKKEHRPARDTSDYNGTSTSQPNGRSQSHRSSANATPAPTSTASTPVEEKDMYTNERERLAQARLLAEKQRRAKQASSRTSNPKYEDELQRDLLEGEKARYWGGRGGR